MTGSRRDRSYRALVQDEVDLLPLMNLFVVLIPMLLLSAVFFKVAVIQLGLADPAQAAEPSAPAWQLSIAIAADQVEVDSPDGHASFTSMEECEAALRVLQAQHSDRHDATLVAGDDVHYERVIAVMDAARAAGFHEVALGAEPASAEATP